MGEIFMKDVLIIGGGIIGCAIARELSKYKLDIVLLEKLDDISLGASKANSGIVHGAYSTKYGTLKGEMCAKGNSLYDSLNKELNFGFRKTGALTLAFEESQLDSLKDLKENGEKYGEKGLKIITRDEILKIEPNIGEEVIGALYSETVGVTSPYEAAIALAENAITNGLELNLNTEVLSIEKTNNGFKVNTNNGIFEAKKIINCAGVYSDNISAMVGDTSFKILPRKGQYVLLGKDQGDLVNTVVFQAPTKMGKGVLVVKTFHGNCMIGPDAIDIENKEDKDTSIDEIELMVETARKSIPNFNIKRALTTFSGIRACSDSGDFIIEESKVEGFINVGGIQSPGLTSAPAIAIRVSDILKNSGFELALKEDFNPYRKGIIIKKEADFQGKIDHEDDSLNIICRCEKVTKQEILDSFRRGIDFATTDGVKRRTRAGMGDCQGFFCRPRVSKIISELKDIALEEVKMRSDKEGKTKRVPINEIRKIDK
jgi:glycerol-3-phosphate dehydrogenase